MKTSRIFLGLASVYVIANVAAYLLRDSFSIGGVFELFGLYLPPVLILSTLFGWQLAGRPKPVTMGLFLVFVLVVAAVNTFFVWLQGYAT